MTESVAWEDVHLQAPHYVTFQADLSIHRIGFSFIHENIAGTTDWLVNENDHTLLVYLAGEVGSHDTVFENGPSRIFSPKFGDTWVVPAGRRCAALARGRRVSFCQIKVPSTQLADKDVIPLIGGQDPLLKHLVESLEVLIGSEDDLAQMMRDTLSETIRLHVCRTHIAPCMIHKDWRDRPLTDEERRRLSDHLRDRLDAHHSLAEMSALVSLPVSEFLKAFKSTFYATPHQFLIKLRIDKAKEMLLTSRTSITEIALATGFASSSHFATSFRKYVGISPSEYRSH